MPEEIQEGQFFCFRFLQLCLQSQKRRCVLCRVGGVDVVCHIITLWADVIELSVNDFIMSGVQMAMEDIQNVLHVPFVHLGSFLQLFDDFVGTAVRQQPSHRLLHESESDSRQW